VLTYRYKRTAVLWCPRLSANSDRKHIACNIETHLCIILASYITYIRHLGHLAHFNEVMKFVNRVGRVFQREILADTRSRNGSFRLDGESTSKTQITLVFSREFACVATLVEFAPNCCCPKERMPLKIKLVSIRVLFG